MLQIGIVGLPNVGKSTLFNAITKAGVESANYPFATIDRNVGVVPVPDPRLEPLADVYDKGGRRPPIVPTTVEFVDIAGLVRGASRGEGLGNQFLAHIREVAAIAHVVRCFEDDDVVHVAGAVDPLADIETIDTELALADIATLEKRRDRLRRSAKADPDDAALLALVDRLLSALGDGRPARALNVDLPPDLQLLTAKPVIYVCNVAEQDLASGNRHTGAVRARAQEEGAETVTVSARIEQELAELAPDEAEEFLRDLGVERSGLERLIATGYRTLDLITFFTASEKEVRAWTVREGAHAPEAAGKIHSDMERGFIRAETIAWDVLTRVGGTAAARAKGLLRTEGKGYRVHDGDVMHILFSV
ncbi:MAG: redox-regulated ATPase YchF [Deinococcus-Thermus bacterium]|jgi:GTP-binding protein YchF|nr:redox-regulated ATPase YchF [Deinococcota bacterium]